MKKFKYLYVKYYKNYCGELKGIIQFERRYQ